MIYLLFMGIFQATLLPGLLLCKGLNNTSNLDKLILSGLLSLPLNYILVGISYLLGIYNHYNFIILFIFEFILLFLNINKIIKKVILIFRSYHSSREIDLSISYTRLISFFLLLISSLILIYLSINEGFVSFRHWDSVVSWNRWAVELYEGNFNGSMGYPIGLPVLYSVIYTFAGTSNVETFSKLISFWYYLLLAMINFSIIRRYRDNYKGIHFSIVTIIFLILMSRLSGSFVFSGITDPLISVYGIFLFYLIYLLNDGNENNQKIIFVITTCIASSSLLKITGLFYILFFLLMVIFSNKIIFINKLVAILLSIFVGINWYFISYIYLGPFPIAMYESLVDKTIIARLINLISIWFKAYGLFLIPLFLISLISLLPSKICRVIWIFLILPSIIFVSFVASYDIRASLIILGPISYCFASGLLYLFELFIKINNKIKIIIVSILITIIAILAPIIISESRINAVNTRSRLSVNDVTFNSLNNYLVQLSNKDEYSKFISCWQMPYGILELSKRYIPTGNCDFTTVDEWLKNKDIIYYLYWNPSPSEDLYPTMLEVENYLNNKNINFKKVIFNNDYALYFKL